MIDARDWNDAQADVEALVRAAGGYVRASDDLRPRVLEAARLQSGERRARQRIRHVALVAAALAFMTAASPPGLDGRGSRPAGFVLAAGLDDVFSPAAGGSARCGDGDWRMIEAFTELRRQQAQVLRFSL
jgi:poly(3-hydroxybutyrate) depolymerase